jgi:LemA protein
MRVRNGSIAIVLAGVGLAIILVMGLLMMSYSNSFVAMEEDVNGKWAQVDNQLKRRADLVPNLVEVVKGYAKHEKEVFENIANARAKMAGGGSPAEKMQGNQELTGALSRLLVVAEQYPNLKADANFTRLMDELAGTENRLAVERQRYNEAVQKYNTSLRQLPGSLVAGVMGFKAKHHFEVAEADKKTPQVKF